MKTRIIAGVTAAILVLLLLALGTPDFIFIVVSICSLLAYLEYDRLLFTTPSKARRVRVCLLILVSLFAIVHGPQAAWVMSWGSFALIGASQVFSSERHSDFPLAVRTVSLEWLGYVYVVSLFGFIVPIVSIGLYGRYYLLLLFLLVFMGDTAAYFVGSRWGKHRLAPHISPKKSTEGAWAAIVMSILVAVCWYWLTPLRGRGSRFLLEVILFAPVVSGLAQLGDLFESILKRSQAQKDSGAFLPGHGGLLDRIDGLSLASPLFYFYVLYLLERA